ncbi:MAG: hypothetical protein M3N24_06315 [Actinomycetota bacterium]|nr:hypothetical protein [Actinomycetota bacterium]
MDERRWEQVAAATGIAFVVLLVIGTFIAGQPPDADARAGEIRSYFADKRSAIEFQAFVLGLAGILFIWFAGTLRAFLASAEGESRRLSLISFAGAIGVLSTLVPTVVVNLTLASGGVSGAVGEALFRYASWYGVLVVFSVAVFVGAASLSAGRTGVLPQWFAWAGLAVAALHLLQSLDLFLDADFLEPTGFLGYLNLIAVLLWILAASVLVLQRLGGTTRARSR